MNFNTTNKIDAILKGLNKYVTLLQTQAKTHEANAVKALLEAEKLQAVATAEQNEAKRALVVVDGMNAWLNPTVPVDVPDFLGGTAHAGQ